MNLQTNHGNNISLAVRSDSDSGTASGNSSCLCRCHSSILQSKVISALQRIMMLLTQLKTFSSHVGSSAAEASRSPNQLQQVVSPSVSDESSFMEPDFAMDYSNTLFSTFNQLFPDPKEICKNFVHYYHSLAFSTSLWHCQLGKMPRLS